MNCLQSRGMKLGMLSTAHLFNDWYINYVQTLLPFLVAAGLPLAKGAFLVSAFTISSSLIQPFFGYLVDRKGQRWLVYVGTVWMALLLAPFGVVSSYPALFALALLAGLGTGAFHPQASAMVSAAAGGASKGFQQSLFVASGNVGLALTPLMLVPFIERFGLGLTPVFVLPGIVVAALLWASSGGEAPVKKSGGEAPRPIADIVRKDGVELGKLLCAVALRSLAYFGLITFLPLLLRGRGVSTLAGGNLLFVMLFAGALGGLVGGFLSDKIGRKPVIVGSLALASPLFLLFLFMDFGVLSWFVLGFGGAALLASFSVTVVLAQERVGRNAAMASGLMLGFGIGMGGLGVGVIGLLAERIGLETAVLVLAGLPLAGALAASFIKEAKSPKASGSKGESVSSAV